MTKINLDCASRLLKAINVDMDSISEIRVRYPNIDIDDNIEFLQANVLNLPFDTIQLTKLGAMP